MSVRSVHSNSIKREMTSVHYKLTGKGSSNDVKFDGKTLSVECGKITKISEVTLSDY